MAASRHIKLLFASNIIINALLFSGMQIEKMIRWFRVGGGCDYLKPEQPEEESYLGKLASEK